MLVTLHLSNSQQHHFIPHPLHHVDNHLDPHNIHPKPHIVYPNPTNVYSDPDHPNPHPSDPRYSDPNNPQNPNDPNDPIVGIGLGLPLIEALTLGAKAKAAILGSVAEASALAIKAKADVHKTLLQAKIKHDLATARARANVHNALFYHHPILLGATHDDTKEGIMEEVNEAMSEYPQELTQNVGAIHDALSHPIYKRDVEEVDAENENPDERKSSMTNRKKNEELFVWSLNNWNNNYNFKRSVRPENEYEIRLSANPNFWENYQLQEKSPYLRTNIPQDWKPNAESNNFVSIYPGNWKYGENTYNSNLQITPISYQAPYQRESEDERAAHGRHFHSHFFHKRPLSFSSLHHRPELQPKPDQVQIDHWGNPTTLDNLHSTANLHNLHSPTNFHNLHSPLKPTHVTINNQQNTFSNAVSGSMGSQSIQVSQNNGPASTNQAQSSAKSAETVSSPYLIQFPFQRLDHHRKRSIEGGNDIDKALTEELHLLHELQDDEVFQTFKKMEQEHWNRIRKMKDEPKVIGWNKFPKNAYTESRKMKRSLPLMRLMVDPNAKLDMPKTLENVGTIARNSFEDKRAPMYHVRNMVGSAKNAVLSAIKIAPQELLIPSQYKIVDTSTDVVLKPADIESIKARASAEARSNNNIKEVERKPQTLRERIEKLRYETLVKSKPPPSCPIKEQLLGQSQPQDPILNTFQKVGTVIRDSVKSGQETIQHITDAAHSARKVISTARFSAPRILLPYARAPILQPSEKLMLIAPRFLDVSKDNHEEPKSDFVKMGDIMNAFGVSNPDNEKVGLRRVVIQKNKPLFENGKMPIFQARFGEDEPRIEKVNKYYVISEDIEDGDMEKTVKNLEGIKDVVGAGTVKDFLIGMKRDFDVIKEKLKEKETVGKPIKDKVDEDAELKDFLIDLFKSKQQDIVDERVGIGLKLPENLLRPFMAQPSKTELETFFRENGDSLEETDLNTNGLQHFLQEQLVSSMHDQKSSSKTPPLSPRSSLVSTENKEESIENELRSIVSSINPDLYKAYFNETLHIRKGTDMKHPEHFFTEENLQSPNPNMDEEEQRTSMKIHKKLLKPYMGKIDVEDDEYGQPYGGYYERPYGSEDEFYY